LAENAVNVLNIRFSPEFSEKVEFLLENRVHFWFLTPKVIANGDILVTEQGGKN